MVEGKYYDRLKKDKQGLWRQLKAAAALRGITIRQWLEEAIVEKLKREEAEREGERQYEKAKEPKGSGPGAA